MFLSAESLTVERYIEGGGESFEIVQENVFFGIDAVDIVFHRDVPFLLHTFRKYFSLFPSSRKEVYHAGYGIAVGHKSIAENKAVKSPAESYSKQPAQSYSQGNAVKNSKHHT